VLIADYVALRRMKLDLAGLYRQEGPYWYVTGVNPIALASLLLGMSLCIPGFLATLGKIYLTGDLRAPEGAETWPAIWGDLYNYAWFTSFGAAFASYLGLMLTFGRKYLRR
jgi:NCS1 family nucleobase:cation symporter-1